MYLIQKGNRFGRWSKKIVRLHNISAVWLNDLLCEMSWQLGGGKHYYIRNYHKLVSKYNWCFIVGCNNSGTSLLHRILSKSSSVSTLPYEGQMYTRILARARKKGQGRVWSEFADELTAMDRRSMNDACRLIHDWTKPLKTPIRRMILEKTPANVLRIGWFRQIFPGSRFIAMVRNGYVVAEGIRRKGGQDAGRGARHWNTVNKLILNEIRNKEDGFLLLRYEDLTSRLEETMKKVALFLNIDATELEKTAGHTFTFETISGMKPTGVSNFNQQSLARLNREDIDIIRANASEMLDYFGYRPN